LESVCTREEVQLKYLSTGEMVADALTKALTKERTGKLRTGLGMVDRPSPMA